MILKTVNNASTALIIPAPDIAGITGINVPDIKSINTLTGFFFLLDVISSFNFEVVLFFLPLHKPLLHEFQLQLETLHY